jgi:hypothetical protein
LKPGLADRLVVVRKVALTFDFEHVPDATARYTRTGKKSPPLPLPAATVLFRKDGKESTTFA